MKFAVALILLAAMLGCSRPPASEIVRTSATELLDAYDGNEVAADLAFKGKRVIGKAVAIGVSSSEGYAIIGATRWGKRLALTDALALRVSTKNQALLKQVAEIKENDVIEFEGVCHGQQRASGLLELVTIDVARLRLPTPVERAEYAARREREKAELSR